MKNIKVELLHYTPMPVLLKALSMPYKKECADLTLAQKVINVLKHESVSEHVNMNFFIDGVSRMELQEHMRHRITSTTCESTRYTLQAILDSLMEEDHVANYIIDQYFVTPCMNKEEDWVDLLFHESETNYNLFIFDLQQCYSSFVLMFEKWKAYGLKNDYLKYALPEGYRTRFVWSLNLRSLKNFLNLRDSANAHFEIRHVSKLIKETFTNTYIEKLL